MFMPMDVDAVLGIPLCTRNINFFGLGVVRRRDTFQLNSG